MLGRLGALVAVVMALSGCVLQSAQPFFREADGELALGRGPTVFDGYELKDGTWSKSNSDEPGLLFTPADHHYIVAENKQPDKKDDKTTALFAPLKDGWYALQLVEDNKPPIYALAKLDGSALLVEPLLCDDLKQNSAAASHVDYAGYDCMAKDVNDPRQFLLDIAAHSPEPQMKLVPAP